MAMFTQKQNTDVSPVFEFLIRLRSHTVHLFTVVKTVFTNAFSENPELDGTEPERTTSSPSRHTVREQRTNACLS